MATSPLTDGELVRYQATKRWHVAVVRAVDGEHVEVEFFWGGRERVEADRVERFRDHLADRSRALSLERAELCRAFFNKPLTRLRGPRVRTIQQTLRRHGCSFEPVNWPRPNTKIQIRLDDSVVVGAAPAKTDRFDDLLPRWLEPIRMPPSSRDPLGLQAHAERLANDLLPGLTVFTSRIGYYGFLTWAVRLVNGRPCPGGRTRLEQLLRLERALALCEFVHHGAHDHSCPLLGQRSKTQVLQSAVGDTLRVPARILKNQASAGAYRLYFTSLQSVGLAREAPEMAAEGFLPVALTPLGERVAHGFGQRVDDDFAEAALADKPCARETVRAWGAKLCFSRLGERDRYRTPFLEGFLLGDGPEAERRYRTLQRLFRRGLLTGAYDETEAADPGSPAEEDAGAAEAPPEAVGLGNDRVLLHFYEEDPQPDNRDLQTAAVFELLGLGLSALFQALVTVLRQSGRVNAAVLAGRIADEGQLREEWVSPPGAGQSPAARELVRRLVEANDAIRRAALGGVLLVRVLRDPPFAAVADGLATNPALALVDAALRSRPERSLAEALPDLVAAMVERHQVVSANKNRQRWCYLDGETVVRDDLQEMKAGLHAFRFPQLYSLCCDLRLCVEDLGDGD